MNTTCKLSALVLALALTACGGGSKGAGTTTTPDGDKINLTLSPNGTVTANTTYGNLTGQNNPNSFYGVWKHNSGDKYQLRYQGTEATDIPKTGKATYIGDAVWLSSLTGDYRQGGSTTLNVDFAEKSVDGKIEFSLLNDGRSQDITLHKGQLNGSHFSGDASTILSSGGKYEGNLFGKNATEAAGIVNFGEGSSLNAAFGGKR